MQGADIAGRTDDDIIAAIAVDVPCRRHGKAEMSVGLIAFGHPVGWATQARRRSVVDVGSPLVRLAVIVQMRTNDHVSVAIAIKIPGSSYRDAQFGRALVAYVPPIERDAQAGG